MAPEISLVALLGALLGVAPPPLPRPRPGGRRMIELRDLSFRYAESRCSPAST